jgi:hypothetical protein
MEGVRPAEAAEGGQLLKHDSMVDFILVIMHREGTASGFFSYRGSIFVTIQELTPSTPSTSIHPVDTHHRHLRVGSYRPTGMSSGHFTLQPFDGEMDGLETIPTRASFSDLLAAVN